MLAAGGINDRAVCLWDSGTGRLIRKLEPRQPSMHENEQSQVCFSPDGRLVAAKSQTAIRVWEVATSRQRWQADGWAPDTPSCLCFSPDGKTLVSATSGGSVLMGDAARGERLQAVRVAGERRRFDDRITALAFSPDGRTLAVASLASVRLLEAATGKERHRSTAGARAVAFSPDGLSVAAGDWDTTAVLWDVTGRQEGGRLRKAALAPAAVRALWDDLGGEDAEKAYRAVWALAAGADQAVPFFKEHLHPVPKAGERVRRLIRDLSDDKFRVREKAAAELARLGKPAAPALRRALQGKPSLEARRRIEALLRGIEGDPRRPRCCASPGRSRCWSTPLRPGPWNCSAISPQGNRRPTSPCRRRQRSGAGHSGRPASPDHNQT